MNYKKVVVLLLVFLTVFIITSLVRNSQFTEQLFSSKTTIKFESDVYDFRELKHKKEKGTYFVYINQGNSSLKIENITSNCGCTIPKWSREKLKPKGVDSIFVTYDSQTLGYFSKAIYVFSNSKTSPDVLYIKGVVKK